MASEAADKVLDMVQEHTPLTLPGEAFFKVCTDPMHDQVVDNLTGYPDGNNGQSVVQRVRSTMTVAKPGSLGGTGWDLHVYSLPILGSIEYFRGYTVSRAQYNATAGGDQPVYITSSTPTTGQYVRLSSICAYANTVGSNQWNPFDGNVANVTAQNFGFHLFPDWAYTNGNYRCFAKGYECRSIGPALYKAGMVHVWSLPTANTPAASTGKFLQVNPATGAVTLTCDQGVTTYSYPPGSIGEAVLIPTTKSWAAEKGTYVPDTLNTSHPFSSNSPDTAIAFRDSSSATNGTPNTPACVLSRFGNRSQAIPGVTGNVTYPAADTVGQCAFNTSGCFFSGLSDSDVIEITAVWYIERFPSDTERDLLVLGSPSPMYDMEAFKLYNAAISRMPPGVMVDENSFGDFFTDIVEVIADVAAPAMSMLPGPLGMMGKAAAAGAGIVKKLAKMEKSPTEVVEAPSVMPQPKNFVAKPAQYTAPRTSRAQGQMNPLVSKMKGLTVKSAEKKFAKKTAREITRDLQSSRTSGRRNRRNK